MNCRARTDAFKVRRGDPSERLDSLFVLHEVQMQHPVLELEVRRCAALMTKDCRPGTAVTKRKAASAAAHARVDFFDAPFFGSLKEAEAGVLLPVVGGDPDMLSVLDAFRSLISCWFRRCGGDGEACGQSAGSEHGRASGRLVRHDGSKRRRPGDTA